VVLDEIQNDDILRLFNYFRMRPMTLLTAMSKKEVYFEGLKLDLPIKSAILNVLKKVVENKALLIRLKKIIYMKGKYKYREKFNFAHSL
jgi:hypothetical protein